MNEINEWTIFDIFQTTISSLKFITKFLGTKQIVTFKTYL